MSSGKLTSEEVGDLITAHNLIDCVNQGMQVDKLEVAMELIYRVIEPRIKEIHHDH